MVGCILSRQRLRWLSEVVGDVEHDLRIVLCRPLIVARHWTVEDAPRKSQRRACHGRRTHWYELLVVERDLGDVPRHMLQLCVDGTLSQSQLQEARDGRMADDPVKRLQHVPLHLSEHIVVVERAAHGFQFADCGYALFLITVLGGDEESSAADELVVTLVNDTARTVTIEEVDGEMKRLREELKCVMSLQQEVQEVWSHKPLNLRLDLDGRDIRHGLQLLHVSDLMSKEGVRNSYLHALHVAQYVSLILLRRDAREPLCQHLLALPGNIALTLPLGSCSSIDPIVVIVTLDEIRITISVCRVRWLRLELLKSHFVVV